MTLSHLEIHALKYFHQMELERRKKHAAKCTNIRNKADVFPVSNAVT